MINYIAAYACCSEDITTIQNYEQAVADQTQIWICHHKLGIDKHMSRKQLIAANLYYNRPAIELIFLTRSEHIRIHMIGNDITKGRHLSEQHKRKLSIAGKGKKRTIETRTNISNALKGRTFSDEHRKKISEARKGKKPWNTGKTLSDELKKMISERTKEAMRSMKYWNNGVKCVCSKECPGEG